METSHKQTLPEQFSMATLERNLAALAHVDEALVQRLCLPVNGRHVHFLENGRICYQRHRTLFPFVINRENLAKTLGNMKVEKDLFIFGIGLGEQLDYLLQRLNGFTITAWDRDPWLIRLVLMQRDYSRHILSGRLQLQMGADILDIIDMEKDALIIYHPFLGLVYKNEGKLFDEGVGEKRCIICSGDLFVDDTAKALKGFGYSLYTLDIENLSIEEMEATIKRFDPQVVFAINYTNGLVDLCYDHGVDLICWEIDPAADRLKLCKSPTDRAHVFTYRKGNIGEFLKAGFKNVGYLPCASDIEKRSPTQLTTEEHEFYSSPLAFVGSSMIQNANSFRDVFLSHYRAFCGGPSSVVEQGNRLLEEILAVQREDYSIYVVPDLLRQKFPDFIYLLGLHGVHDPFMLAGEIAAAEKRINYIANLGNLGMKVWGDDGWRITEQYGARYMGSAGHNYEINKVYCASHINIDINRLYQRDIIPMRIFDIMACGGFVLAEYSRELGEIFEIGKEVETYRTLDELISKAAYYLDHRDEALEIARRGREAVRKNHTISMRVNHMLNDI